MFIIVGGTGRIGSAAAKALLERRKPVTVVTRDPSKAKLWQQRGAEIALTDVRDIDRTRRIFHTGRRAFIMNPPADPSSDTDQFERETVRCLLAALEDSGLERVVALSTYGVRPGEACGDLTVLYELEQGLKVQPIPSVVVRAAYLMSNWDGALAFARNERLLPSLLPEDLRIPMVAPDDVGRIAAELLEVVSPRTLYHVEGPATYSPVDVAEAFGMALGRSVEVQTIPPEAWERTFLSLGFSEAAALSYTRMTQITVRGYEAPSNIIRGKITLEDYSKAKMIEN